MKTARALILLLVLAMPAASAATWYEDAAQDQVLKLADTVPVQTPEVNRELDIVAVGIEESLAGFKVGVTTSHSGQELFGGICRVHFSFAGASYAVVIPTFDMDAGLLRRVGEASEYAPIAVLGAPEQEGPTQSVTVPRHLVTDAYGATPAAGQALVAEMTECSATWGSFNMQSSETKFMEFYDRAPDEGDAGVAWTTKFGLPQQGSARLHSPQPFRFSNGEETTIVFSAVAQNVGTEPETYRLALRDVPAGWMARLPLHEVHLAPGEAQSLNIPVRTAFGHQHGSAYAVTLEMAGTTQKDALAQLELGVRYLDPAQPAGHHDTVYFHVQRQSWSITPHPVVDEALYTAMSYVNGRDWREGLYMNTLADDEADLELDVEPFICSQSPLVSSYCWNVRLQGLQLGLDFRLDAEGTVSVPVKASAPLLDATLDGELYHVVRTPRADGGWDATPTSLALVTSDAFGLGAGEGREIQAKVRPTVDLVPPQEDAELVLVLRLSTARPDTLCNCGPSGAPSLQPGGWMQLPLLDYVDPTPVSVASSELQVVAVTPADGLRARPGARIDVPLVVRNIGTEALDVRLTPMASEGVQASAAPQDLRIAAGGTKEATLRIQIPAAAQPGDGIHVNVEAMPVDSLAAAAVTSVHVVVDPEAPAQSLTASAKDAPGPGAALLLAGLALLAVRRGRGIRVDPR